MRPRHIIILASALLAAAPLTKTISNRWAVHSQATTALEDDTSFTSAAVRPRRAARTISPTDNGPASRGSGDCSANELQGKEPAFKASAAKNITRLCSPALAIGHSPITRTPLWVAEHLTPERSRAGSDTERVSEFYPDPRLPASQRAELADYSRSGYDRGHLAPSADMPSIEAQRESFTLANIAPQSAELNRGPWADLEISLRKFARQTPHTYVVTGVLFEGKTLATTPTGRVYIPTSFWKAIGVPGYGSVVYVAANRDDGQPIPISTPDFTQRYGIDPFPALDPSARRNTIRII